MTQSSGVGEPDIHGQRFTLPAELEDGRIPHFFGSLTVLFSCLFFAALVWASFAEIRELAISQGEIAPYGQVQKIEHLEGGQIETIYFREGDQVEAGDILVQLSPIAAAADLKQLHARAANLRLRKEALSALIEGRAPYVGELAKSFPELAADQMQIYTSRRLQAEEERHTLEATVLQRKGAYQSVIAEAQSLKNQLVISEEQLAIQTKLLKAGLVARTDYLEYEAVFENFKSQTLSVKGRINSAREHLSIAQHTLEGNAAQSQNQFGEERGRVSIELAELDQQISKFSDRVDRLAVRSPVHGTVQEIVQNTPGEVIRPGDLVATIVPLDSRVVAEVRVRPQDIGHIRTDDEVEVKLSTFDPNVFGVIKGRVGVISASTFKNSNDEPYYKAIIHLDQTYVGEGIKRRTIQPGMIVQADIITGSKSLIQYILKPVYRSLDIGFSER